MEKTWGNIGHAGVYYSKTSPWCMGQLKSALQFAFYVTATDTEIIMYFYPIQKKPISWDISTGWKMWCSLLLVKVIAWDLFSSGDWKGLLRWLSQSEVGWPISRASLFSGFQWRSKSPNVVSVIICSTACYNRGLIILFVCVPNVLRWLLTVGDKSACSNYEENVLYFSILYFSSPCLWVHVPKNNNLQH